MMAKTLIRAACLAAILVGSVLLSAPAFAANGELTVGTTTVVTAKKATMTTGARGTFSAIVTPGAAGPHLTGSITWSIVGSDGSVVSCATNTVRMGASAKSHCFVASGQMRASESPYAVTATYSGDSNYLGSSGSLDESMVTANSRLKVGIIPEPADGQPSTFTVTVTASHPGITPTGAVFFAVQTLQRNSNVIVNANCSNLVQDDVQLLNEGVASCTLPAGWFTILPMPTSGRPVPYTKYNYTIAYSGSGDFNPRVKQGRGIIYR